MWARTVFLVLILAFLESKPCRAMHQSKWKSDTTMLTFKDGPSLYLDREKRGYIDFAAVGLQTLRKLLSGATPARSIGKKNRIYEKEGNLATALRDFYSVRPVKIEETITAQGIKVLKAKSGDRALSLQTTSFKGYPILDIIDYKNKRSGGQYVDRILYKTKEIKKNDGAD